jgi:hypothetical protein
MQIEAGKCRFILAYVSRAKVYVFSQTYIFLSSDFLSDYIFYCITD